MAYIMAIFFSHRLSLCHFVILSVLKGFWFIAYNLFVDVKNDELTHKKTIDSKILKSKENNFAKFVCISKFAIEMFPLTNNTLVRYFKTRTVA